MEIKATDQFDIVVIGAGSAGLVAALTAHRRGLKTAMLEKHKVGGECTHTGCVPSKAFIQSVKQYISSMQLEKYGLPSAEVPQPDFAQLMEHVNRIVEGIYETEKPEIFQAAGIETIVHSQGAKFLDPHTVRIGERVIQATYFVIATGSSPSIPSAVAGLDTYKGLHNENFWDRRKQPESILFAGGGIISAEIGQSLARLGTRVIVLDRNPRILKTLDDDTAEYMINILKSEGVETIEDSTVKRVEKIEEGVRVYYDTKGAIHTLEVEEVFWATGRRPNIHGMGLENARVEYTPQGIVSNEYLQTTQPHIYVCGDVTTPAKFTHTAAYQAEICLDNITFEEKRTNDLTDLPWTIFTAPEIGRVGLSEKEAQAKYGEKLSVFKVTGTIDRYKTDVKEGGFLKVFFDDQDHVVGAEAIGEQAGEWIQQITLVMKNKIPVKNMAQTIYAYPTYTEIVKKVFSRYYRTKGY